ncbi:MAG: iron chelate uptake ABC transporter family permease subunit, partial [Oscillospiraceae bacterium]|nr:iron chelate uptake ABC transporter family permease subunit [Oscillospiraceae bacterium]
MEDKRKSRWIGGYILLAALMLVLLILNAAVGSTSLSAGEVFRVVFTRGGSDMARSIVWNIRMPRLLAAALLGGALSVSGLLLQTFFANPIAGPFVLGISSGAKLFVALAMIGLMSRGIQTTSIMLVAAAFAGAMAAMGF